MVKKSLEQNMDDLVVLIESVQVLTVLSNDASLPAKKRRECKQKLRRQLRDYRQLFFTTTRQINNQVWENQYF